MANQAQAPQGGDAPLIDGLADAWTEDETLRAQVSQRRRDDDIPPDQFELYQACMDETLEEPDELWTVRPDAAKSASKADAELDTETESEDEKPEALRIYHFIRHYPDETPHVWFVVVARETEDEEQIEILDAFPTRDGSLVERYRRGDQEIGVREQPTPSRLVH